MDCLCHRSVFGAISSHAKNASSGCPSDLLFCSGIVTTAAKIDRFERTRGPPEQHPVCSSWMSWYKSCSARYINWRHTCLFGLPESRNGLWIQLNECICVFSKCREVNEAFHLMQSRVSFQNLYRDHPIPCILNDMSAGTPSVPQSCHVLPIHARALYHCFIQM